MPWKKRVSAATVEDYLASLPKRERAALETLRRTIGAAAPNATELISYQIPAFKHHGLLVGYGAFRDHLSFFVMKPGLVREHATELAGFDVSGGTVHFAPGKTLPAALVHKFVKARIEQNERPERRDR